MAVGGYWYYNRSQEGRYRRTDFCSCGEDVEIGRSVHIRSPGRMKIGNGVFIAGDCFIDAIGGVQVGNYCALAGRVTILTLDHQHRGAESLPYGETRIVKPVVIEDYVWVGMYACILPGVTIGEGAIIGLGAVVPRDVPSRAIVVGNPGRVVGYREKEAYDSLKNRGAVRSAVRRCGRLWIPPEIRSKYRDLLMEVGYDVDAGGEYFEFDEYRA